MEDGKLRPVDSEAQAPRPGKPGKAARRGDMEDNLPRHLDGEPRELRHADTEEDLHACFAVMRELRPHLQGYEDFAARVRRMRGEGYRLLAGWQADVPVALAGYRLQENLVYGPFLYVDDLVVKEGLRGGRWGSVLLREVTAIAQREGCVKLVLDTALSNALAQRFYFREGLLTGTMRFSKLLPREET